MARIQLKIILLFSSFILTLAQAQTNTSNNIEKVNTFTVKGYTIEGNTLIDSSTLSQQLTNFIGAEKTLSDVHKAADTIRDYYVQSGYPIVQVFTPEQAVTENIFLIQVVEGKIEKIEISGNQYFSDENILNSLPALKIGQSPKAQEISEAINFANENPLKQVTLDLGQGAKYAEINAKIAVQESNPISYSLGVDNGGSLSSGYDRFTLGFNNADLTGSDDSLSLQLSMPRKTPESGLSLSTVYRKPFYSKLLMWEIYSTLSRNRSISDTAAGSLYFSGGGVYVGTRLGQSLTSIGSYRHKITYGLDYKDFGNDCSISGINLDNCGSVSSMPLSITYQNNFRFDEARFANSLSWVKNIIGGPHSDNKYYEAARNGANNKWGLFRINSNVSYTFSNLWQINALINSQWSNNYLIPSEQFGIGGGNTVRGYDERTAAGDSGWVFNLEAQSPNFGRALEIDNLQMRAVIFADVGEVQRNFKDAVSGCSEINPTLCKRTKLSSVGVGLRIQYGRSISFRFDIANVQKTWINNSNKQDSSSISRALGNRAEGTERKNGQIATHLYFTYNF